MYRDDAEAAQLRIRSLEADLAARDAEIADLKGEIRRFEGRVPTTPWPRVWPILVAMGTGALGLAAGLEMSTTRPSSYPYPSLTGVAECDLYLDRSEACFYRSTDAVREASREPKNALRASLLQEAASVGGRRALPNRCAQLLSSLARDPSCSR